MSPEENLPTLKITYAADWVDYALLDSGGGKKLERYGDQIFVCPEPQAVWQSALSDEIWEAAHASYETRTGKSKGHWEFYRKFEREWVLNYKYLKFRVRVSASRHVGVFPEHASQWDRINGLIHSAPRSIQVLNLFGYTGLATLAAAQAGAAVTHVDASRRAIREARDNQALSGLDDRPIRWIVDDALKFVKREGRRGRAYDGLILDPPMFGRGPGGEVWEFFEYLPMLLKACGGVLSDQPLFVSLTAYGIRASALCLHYALEGLMHGHSGRQETGELALIEESAGRVISPAIHSTWIAN